MPRRVLSTLAAAALLGTAAPALADDAAASATAAPAVAALPAAAVAASAPAVATPQPDAGYDRMQKRLDELEARVRHAEEKVAEYAKRRSARAVPPDSHGESW